MTDTIECSMLGHDLRYRSLRIETPDGLTVGAQDWGRATSGRDVLFLHGFSQSHLCWLKQVTGPLADTYRLVTYDNRGHGISDKPQDPSFYREPERWAGEVDAVIRQAGLDRPALVAWSYAGRIALDYLSVHGDSGISALVMAAATSAMGPALAGPAAPFMLDMGEPELARSIEAARKFVRACFAAPPSPEEVEVMLSFSTVTPSTVRAALVGRPADYEATLRALDVPTLVVHGTEDRVVLPATAEHTLQTVRGAQLRIYDGIGHTPFWEAPERFNRDLGAFLASLP
jgi:pimeloyl-ACP methyl ester carboxylesterase